MSNYVLVFIRIAFICALTYFAEVLSQNCVFGGETFNLTFKYNTTQGAVFWQKDGSSIFTAIADPSSAGRCKNEDIAPQGFKFYCEDGGATYIMEITSKPANDVSVVKFTIQPVKRSLTYVPITNVSQCPNSLYDCNQPDEKVEDKFTFSCKSTCTQNHDLILQYQPESGAVQDLENNVSATMVKCNPYADLYNSTFNYIVDSNHAVLGQFNSTTNKVRLIVKMITGGRNETVFETIYFYVYSPGSSSGGECDWCIPVLVPIAVLACVICGCCIYFVICKKKKKEEEEKKKKSENTNMKPLN